MKLKATGLLLALAMMLGVAALPAAAAISVGPHVGAFQAIADVGKTGTCNNNGTGSVSGGGIGLLPGAPVAEVKNAWFTISNGLVVDVPALQGTANLCGRLTAPLQDTAGLNLKEPIDGQPVGIGASCAATKGWGGYGLADFAAPNPDVWISNLGWKATVGGTFIVTGDAGGAKGKKSDLLVAEVQALNENVLLFCAQKALGDKSDPDPFLVAAVYEIVPGLGGTVPKKAPKK